MRYLFWASLFGLTLASALPASAQTRTLWAYGVPGVMVGKYRSDCVNGEGQKYRGQGTVRFSERPGRIPGSNDVQCDLTRTAAPVPSPAVFVSIKGRLVAIASLRHDGRNVYYGNEIVGRVLTGGRLISNDGGGLVAQGGGNLVAQGGGNIVSTGSGNIQVPAGGNLIQDGSAYARPRY